jgi:hypothetical protein
MPSKAGLSNKRNLIDQANARVVLVTSVAVFVLIFCAVAAKTLMSQAAYQNRVISAKRVAVDQLKDDIGAVNALKTSYHAFTSTTQNVLGGNPDGTGSQDGDNAKIVLDALPSSYDFPALATSLEKLLTSQSIQITSISGVDDEVAQSTNTSSASPQPVAMPFNISVTGSYDAIQGLVNTFEHSIRPIQIQTMDISGDQNSLTLNISAQTFYQPAKSLNITSKVVK